MGDELEDENLEMEDVEVDDDKNDSADLRVLMNVPDQLRPASAKPTRMAICHPDREAYSLNIPLCRSCYDKARWTGRRGWSEELKSEVLETAFGKVRRYKEKRKNSAQLDAPDSKQIRTRNPRVAKHAASVMILKSLDGESAARELRPELKPHEQAELGKKLETDPRVHAEVEKQLAKRGLDEGSKEHFVSLLWRYAESTNRDDEQRTLASWRLLGKAFIGERVENVEVTSLKIDGINEGLERMLGQGSDEAQSGSSSFDSVRSQLNMKDDAFDE
jgi:hypothetical protein